MKKCISLLLATLMLMSPMSVSALSNAEKVVPSEKTGYVAVKGLDNTQTGYDYYDIRTAEVSSVSQFAYKNEGMAYAYLEDGNLKITTPQKKVTLKLQMNDPLSSLGDVISDDFGNFYVVWGKENATNDATVETVFISKYSPVGKHVDTTGFVGSSSPWHGDDNASTRVPFCSGNCVSIISDGVLTSYYAKKRYDGHQSDGVIAVNISDMSPYEYTHNTYSGHSFNQSIIYSDMSSELLFASHGDAYSRGFRVNDQDGGYGKDAETLFHFYLEPNANYNMKIVNKTFAQLGGLAETNDGIALVGASAKSIGELAKTEKQNLFVQIFDPFADEISSSMFIGGSERNGATATDINDNQNSSLTNTTDYGVRWLTNYKDKDVIAPQVVEADGNLVILWSTKDDSFYMVLSSTGDIITPETSLNGIPLNSYERPIYYKGSVYWAAAQDGWLKANSIKIK